MRPSLFHRLGRYGPHAHELRLSEALAVLLGNAPTLASSIARGWAGTDVAGPFQVEREAPTGDRLTRVDLSVTVGNRYSPEVLIWIEVKKDSPESGPHQLSGYARALHDHHTAGTRTLVLLSRPGLQLSDQEEVDAVQDVGFVPWTWEEFGSALEVALDASNLSKDSQERFLADNFLEYLREERLRMAGLDSSNLDVASAVDLQVALHDLIESAAARLDDKMEDWECGPRNPVLRDGAPSFRQFWTPRKAPIGEPLDGLLFQWDFWQREQQYEGKFPFAAGLTRMPAFPNERWNTLCEALAGDFEPYHDDYDRLYRWMTLEDVAAHDGLDSQVKALVEFVTEAFAAVSKVTSR